MYVHRDGLTVVVHGHKGKLTVIRQRTYTSLDDARREFRRVVQVIRRWTWDRYWREVGSA